MKAGEIMGKIVFLVTITGAFFSGCEVVSKETIVESGPLIGYILAAVFFLVIFILNRINSTAPLIGDMLLLTGAIVGWTIGILLTPGKGEEVIFGTYIATLGTFVSGYGMAKVDSIFDKKVQADTNFVNTEFLVRILMGIAGFCLGLLCTFIWRSYVSGVGKPGSTEEALLTFSSQIFYLNL